MWLGERGRSCSCSTRKRAITRCNPDNTPTDRTDAANVDEAGRRKACSNYSREKRNRITITDSQTDANSDTYAKAGSNGHTETEANSKVSPPADTKENSGGESLP